MRVRVDDSAAERGVTSVEYALLVAVIVVVLVGGWSRCTTRCGTASTRPPGAPQRPTEVGAVESSAMLE
jgi:hypothetical protein